MERGQKVILGVLAVALSLVAASLWLVPAREADGAGVRRLFPGVDASAVARIEIQTPSSGARLVLERAGDTWSLREPVEARADSTRAEALARTLATLDARGPVEGASPADYGLDGEDAPRVGATLTSGDRLELFVGDPTPVGTGTYVRVGAGLFAARGMLAATLLPAVDDLRERNPWRQDPTRAAAVDLALGDRSWRLIQAGGAWQETGGAPLDRAPVEAWLLRLAELRIVSFGPAPADRAPRGSIEIAWPDGERQRLLAEGAAGDGQTWWSSPGLSEVVALSPEGLPILEQAAGLLNPPAGGAPLAAGPEGSPGERAPGGSAPVRP